MGRRNQSDAKRMRLKYVAVPIQVTTNKPQTEVVGIRWDAKKGELQIGGRKHAVLSAIACCISRGKRPVRIKGDEFVKRYHYKMGRAEFVAVRDRLKQHYVLERVRRFNRVTG